MTYRTLLKAAVLAGIAIEPIFEGIGLFGKWEGGSSRLVAILKSPEQRRSVAVVAVDNCEDLKPNALEHILKMVSSAGPRRIGVDIDTSSSDYASLPPFVSEQIPVIWGRAADYSHVEERFFPRAAPRGNTEFVQSGLTVVGADGDGMVRRYARSYTCGPGRTQILPSFPGAVAGSEFTAETKEILIDFRRRLASQTGANPDRCLSSELLNDQTAQSCLAKLRNKIVIIGTVCDASDEHDTPLGWKDGVEIMADAVDTELEIRPGLRYAAPSRLLLLSWAIAIAIITWAFFRPRQTALYYGFALLCLLTALLLGARVAYGSLINVVFFLPTVAVVAYGPVKRFSKRRIHDWRHRFLRTSVGHNATKSGSVDSRPVDGAAL